MAAGELSQLQTNVLRALAFFGTFRYPLTAEELCQWAYGAGEKDLPQITQMRSALSDLIAQGMVRESSGYVSLGNAYEERAERLLRQSDAVKKWQRVVRYAFLLRLIPGIRGVAVGNSLAYHFTTKESDIDLFVIGKPGALWMIRFLLNSLLRFFRVRPGQGLHPFCTSFFVDDQHLALSSYALPLDPYLAYWVATLIPVIGDEALFSRFWSENCDLLAVLPHAERVRVGPTLSFSPAFPHVRLPGEPLVRSLQKRKFPALIRVMQNRDTRVVVSDEVLKFHTDDRREEFAHRYQELCRSAGISP